jgi:hypothetical protein
MSRLFTAVFIVAVAVFTSCATAGETAGMMAGDPLVKTGVTALASKVGINESYVTMASTAAQSLLGQGKDKTAAIKGGVDQAAAKASADGKAFTPEQTTGLMQGLSGLLGSK